MELKNYPKLRRSAHGVGQNCFHLVWKPKYAYSVLDGEVKSVCERVLCETARQYGFQIFSLEVMPDHVHLFVSLPVSVSVSRALQILKGVSSRRLRQECPGLRRRYWGGHMWSPGKFSRSVGSVTDKAVKHYIECSQGQWKTTKHEIDTLEAGQTQITDF